jgi:ATP-binding cassette subfamily B protein
VPDAASALSIEVDGLTYEYPPGLEQAAPQHAKPEQGPVRALHDVSFRVEGGHTLGIFGPTGSGKTTLVNLLVRLLLPPPGTVRLGDRDVLDWQALALREAVTVVPQDAWLFSRSIRENVGFTDLPSEIDDARIARAVRLACLEEEVASFPDGLETVVGERGVTLSGGQRQRVALARAFYRAPRVLVLDDVLSAVDHATEEQLIKNIRAVSRTMTTLIVSHRISALMHAEQIVVLEDGRVADSGRHHELVARPGVYADTWRYQQEEDRKAEEERDEEVAHG